MTLPEESKMPWAVHGLLHGYRAFGPILFTTGLLLVTCFGHDVNTVTSLSQNITSRTNPLGSDATHEGRFQQDNRSLLTAVSSRQKNTSRVPVTYRISHHGRKRGRASNMKGAVVHNTTTPDQNIRHSKQRLRGKGRGKGKGGKGKGKYRHNKSRSKVGDAISQHSHIRRNLEKQVLVRNRTLELLGGGGARLLWASNGGNSTVTPPINGISSGRNNSNSTRVSGDPSVEQGSPEKSQTQYISARLSNKNSASSDTVIATDERTLRLHVSELSSTAVAGKRVDENATKSQSIAAFQISERSESVTDSTTDVIADSDKRNTFPVPVMISIDDVITDYQYDYDAIGVETSVWFNPRKSRNEEKEKGVSSESGSLEPGPIQAAVGTTLARVLGVLTDHSMSCDSSEMNKEENDPCERWVKCKDKLQQAFLGPLGTLPSCPCQYPSAIFYDDKIWDQAHGKYYRWRDVSGEAERLDVYKPGATYCIRSLLAQGSTSLAAQHCCYDRYRRLLTRGSGAGTPDFVSPEVSTSLHEKVDILPWRLCKGDFTRYNTVRLPNNDNNCTANPDEEEFLQQVQKAQYF